MRTDDFPVLSADWAAPTRVRAFTTLREGGISRGDWGTVGGGDGGLNLGARCGDDPAHVQVNRARVRAAVPDEPLWLDQVHGIDVIDADAPIVPGEGGVPVADAAYTTRRGRVLTVLTADCIPVFLCDDRGEVVGVAHAGWRGLAGGVLEATLASMRRARGGDRSWLAHLGPAIGPRAFEVGDDVREAFVGGDAQAAAAFLPGVQPGKWWADLFELARRRLRAAGVAQITGGQACTVSDAQRFYSHRRDRRTGRMASLIWLE